MAHRGPGVDERDVPQRRGAQAQALVPPAGRRQGSAGGTHRFPNRARGRDPNLPRRGKRRRTPHRAAKRVAIVPGQAAEDGRSRPRGGPLRGHSQVALFAVFDGHGGHEAAVRKRSLPASVAGSLGGRTPGARRCERILAGVCGVRRGDVLRVRGLRRDGDARVREPSTVRCTCRRRTRATATWRSGAPRTRAGPAAAPVFDQGAPGDGGPARRARRGSNPGGGAGYTASRGRTLGDSFLKRERVGMSHPDVSPPVEVSTGGGGHCRACRGQAVGRVLREQRWGPPGASAARTKGRTAPGGGGSGSTRRRRRDLWRTRGGEVQGRHRGDRDGGLYLLLSPAETVLCREDQHRYFVANRNLTSTEPTSRGDTSRDPRISALPHDIIGSTTMADDAAEDPPQAKTPIAISSSPLRVVTALPHRGTRILGPPERGAQASRWTEAVASSPLRDHFLTAMWCPSSRASPAPNDSARRLQRFHWSRASLTDALYLSPRRTCDELVSIERARVLSYRAGNTSPRTAL